MDANKLQIVSYNCKHFHKDGDKFEFVNSLFSKIQFLLLQETWLYESEFKKLLNIGNNSEHIATSAMNQSKHRIGRKFGGTAIVWESSIKGKITKIDLQHERICALLFTKDQYSILIANVYMPCDTHTGDEEYTNILNVISQCLYKYNPSHIIIGGDMNVDFVRNSPNTHILFDFITDFNLLKCIDLPCASVPYTYINHNGTTSRIDHFFVSESLKKSITYCDIIDNHLYSDHVPLRVVLDIDIEQIIDVEERPFTIKKAWHKASDQDIASYKYKLDSLLSDLDIHDSILHCNNYNCLLHREELCTLYEAVINACIKASEHIPNTSGPAPKIKPGWNDQVKCLREDALSWHHFWNINGRPRNGYIAEMHRITRARYHRSIRQLKRDHDKVRMEKMADSLLSDKSRDMWAEIRKLKGHSSKMACSIDGCYDNDDIVNVFSDKYMSLYNSVPFDSDDMCAIKSEISSRIDKCSNGYSISTEDIVNAVTHLKCGKSDGAEGLYSDHFIHGTGRFYVILSLLFTLFLSHGFSPESMIIGTMIPIPKDKKKSLSNSSNYRAIALSSIFSKILDWIILIKEQKSLFSSELQFGFKKGLSTTQCTNAMLETIDYYNFNKSSVYVLLLDASKAFDRVNYVKLFDELLRRDLSPLVLRLLLYM